MLTPETPPTRRSPKTPLSSRAVRTCIGCRSRRTQEHLVRLHVDDRDRLHLDRNGPGRGAWLCAATASACLTTAMRLRAIDRAMRRRVDRASVEALVGELASLAEPDVVS